MKKITSMFLAILIVFSITATGCDKAQKKVYEAKPKFSAIETDVCKLGSPIKVEQTVKEGWHEDHQVIMTAIIDAVEAAGVKDGMLQTEAISRINEYLCNKTVYGENKYCRTIYGALVLHQVVCVGYTLAFQYMAQYCGINAVYVHGRTKTTAHAWNGVYFSDGTYLEVDVTMNDTGGDFNKYLLITPAEMEQFHFS